MRKEDLQRMVASEVKQSIKNQIITVYERNEIPGPNGFKLTWEELCADTEGLEEEIFEIMQHPRKHKTMLKMFVYFVNMMS